MTDEQVIIKFAKESGKSTFAKHELIARTGYSAERDNENYVTVLLTRLVKKGFLIRIKKGLYAINFKKYSF
jgi:predicted transcriptional regulator of viral defense system